MLWSLIKVILFVVLIAAATLGAGYLMETDGGIRIAVANTEFNLAPLQAVIAALLLLLVMWLVLKVASFLVACLRFLNGDETAISRYFDRNRERKGFQALADGMMAIASGEGRLAMTKAQRAERFLQRPDLTNLLIAQAAEMSGDTRKAEDTYKRLLADDRTRFVGVRGIMKQKLAEGDTDTALKLAEKAFALKPRHEEITDTLLRLQAEKSDWTGARETLGAKLRHGTLPRDVYRRRDAVLAISEARDVLGGEDAAIDVQEAAIEANRLSPDLVPAAALAARSYIEQGKARYATRVIKKAWEVEPHPDLAAAFAEIEPEETADARIKRFATLTRIHPDAEETRLLLAELHIAAEDFPGARRALGDLAETHPTARALTIMAAIERGEGGEDSVVRAYLARALTASRGAQWVCDKCHSIHAEWGPICNNCGGFDTLAWRESAEGEGSVAGSTGMLPLIVGSGTAAVAAPPSPAREVATLDQSGGAEEADPHVEDAAADSQPTGAKQVADAEIVEESETDRR